MTTVFVTLSDASYAPKARRTIRELQVHGKWKGDIVWIAVDFTPDPMEGVRMYKTTHLNTDTLLEKFKEHPLKPMPDNRHLGKLYQWDKLQVFKPYFRQWDRVVFIDAGLRVFDEVQPLLYLPWKGRFLAPDDSDPYDNGSRFGRQLDIEANPAVTEELFQNYPESICQERYFNNPIFVFDTSLLEKVTFEDLYHTMNDYPIFMCNETGLMNLIFSYKLRVWTPFPQRVGTKYLFAWSENNYLEGPDWGNFHFIKYSLTHS
jgi:hypothetical protein